MHKLFILFALLSLSAPMNSQSVIHKDIDTGELIDLKKIVNAYKDLDEGFMQRVVQFQGMSVANQDTIYFVRTDAKFPASLLTDDSRIVKNKFLGKKLFDFEYKSLDGDLVNNSSLDKELNIISLWFTKCPPCVAEMPVLSALNSQSDISIIGISFDNRATQLEYTSENEVGFPLIAEASDFTNQFTRAFPMNLIIDREGVIRFIMNKIPFDESFEVDPKFLNLIRSELE